MTRILWLMTGSLVAGGGENPRLGPVEISGMVGVMTALGAAGAFLFKQGNSYKKRKNKFMKSLGGNLYFKNLDNNADAEEEAFKEALPVCRRGVARHLPGGRCGSFLNKG